MDDRFSRSFTGFSSAEPFSGTLVMNSNFSCFSMHSRSASAFWN
uniref:Uncharacterized protein n=1 Tax=Anguilla anguilla TaxID=7936 RepID=A0A0E9PFN6_ANGAN